MQMNPRITISTPYIRANKVQKQSDVRAVHSSVLPIRLPSSSLSILSVFGFFSRNEDRHAFTRREQQHFLGSKRSENRGAGRSSEEKWNAVIVRVQRARHDRCCIAFCIEQRGGLGMQGDAASRGKSEESVR
jgi:hypothetical protein